jgi:diacylglycerol kinase family enzyme
VPNEDLVNLPNWLVLKVRIEGEEPIRLALALVSQSDPWTYLGDRPVRPCPQASFETGLDVFGLTTMPVAAVLRHLQQILAKNPRPHGKRVVSLHDLPAFSLVADQPLAFQLDGDDLGDQQRVDLVSVPNALDVIV